MNCLKCTHLWDEQAQPARNVVSPLLPDQANASGPAAPRHGHRRYLTEVCDDGPLGAVGFPIPRFRRASTCRVTGVLSAASWLNAGHQPRGELSIDTDDDVGCLDDGIGGIADFEIHSFSGILGDNRNDVDTWGQFDHYL